MIVYKRDVNGVSNCSREAVCSTICPRLDMDARVATVILSAQATLAASHQLCAHVCVHRPAGSARSYARRPASSPDLLLLVKSVVTARRAHCAARGILFALRRHALSETTWLASTYSHTTAMSTVRTEAGGAQGKAQAGNCLLLSVPITVHEQEWNAVRWRQSSSLEVCQRNSSRVSAEEQAGGFPDSTVLTARLRLRTDARQRPGVA